MRRSGILLALTLLAAPAAAQQTVGLFVNDEASFEGYTLFGGQADTKTYLIDNGGLLVRSWESAFRPGNIAGYLLENGNLLRTCNLEDAVHPNFAGAAGRGGRIEEYDWDGNLIWEFNYSNADVLHHHDIQRLPNGNILAVAWEYKTRAEAIAAGRNPSRVIFSLWPDHLIEIEPTPPVGGNIVWEWHLWDHLIQDFDPTRDNYGVVADHPELVDINYPLTSTPDWTHFNTVKYNAEFDQIVMVSRTFSEFWVIDHSTTTAEAAGHTGGNYGKGGDLLYRWGNPQAYRRGTETDRRLFFPHDAQWIPPGYPGAGNFLVYNNGTDRPGGDYSSVDEIVPPVDATGNYTVPASGPFEPPDPVWSYTSTPPEDFYSAIISGAERQPNGNTLICEGTPGRLFEVTPDKQIVWQYVNPVNDAGPIPQGTTPTNISVFKVRRYAPDFPAFAGKDLTPGDPIEIFNSPSPIPAGSLSAEPVGNQIEVRWDPTTCATHGYNLVYGNLAESSGSALNVTGAECGVGLSGAYLWSNVPAGPTFFLVVGTDDTGLYESSWGVGSGGIQRNSTRASFECGATTKVVSATCP